VFEVLEPAEGPFPDVPRLPLGIACDGVACDGVAVVAGAPVAVFEEASVSPGLVGPVVAVVEPDIVGAAVVAVEAGGGSGAFGVGSLPAHAAPPRRRMTTELIAILFMKTSRILCAPITAETIAALGRCARPLQRGCLAGPVLDVHALRAM
jgi:hypothetical protein